MLGLLFWRKQKKTKKDCISGLQICPSNPPYLAIIGDLHYQDFQYQKVHYHFTQALKILKECNLEIKLNGINRQIHMFHKIITINFRRNRVKKQISLLPNSSAQDQNQVNEYFERVERIERSVTVIVLPNNETQRPEMQQNMIKQFQNIQQQLKELQKQFQKQNEVINRIQNLDNIQIEFMMEELKKPKNKQILLLYACFRKFQKINFKQIKMPLLKVLQKKVLSLIQNSLKAGSKNLELLPIIGGAFNIINSVLDYGVEYQKEAKFKSRIILLINIMKIFAATLTELEKEIQFAAIKLSKFEEPGLREIQISKFIQFVEKLSLLENSSEQYSRDPYWKKGTADSLKLQKYLEENNDMIIIEDQDKKLRQILIDALLKNYNSISNKMNKSENKTSKNKEDNNKCNIQ